MNQNKFIDKNKRGAKRRKLNGQRNEIQSSHIFKLPVEILEYIFDYLPLRDLNNVSETCKWIQRIAAQCYRKNYSGLLPFRVGRVRGNEGVLIRMGPEDIYMNNFIIQIVDKITISSSECLKIFCNRNWKFHQLRKLELFDFILPNVKVRLKGMKKVFFELEDLQIILLSDFVIDENHLENLLSLTPNIKRLHLRGCVSGNEWLTRKYATLEHCEIEHKNPTDILPIATFLELNPNIHSFGINSENLWENRDSMKVAHIKLENLAIFIDDQNPNKIEQLQSVCQLLNELHRIGLYKRLTLLVRFYHRVFEQELIDEIAKLNVLIKLHLNEFTSYSKHLTLATLTQLEEIRISDSRLIEDLESLATSLEHLERIHFGRSNLDHVMLFISRCSKLKEMKVTWFLNGDENFEIHQIIGLSSLNKERAKLLNATKITLYVAEDVYLATKRVKREIDFDLIKLQRFASKVWDNSLDISTNYRTQKYGETHTRWSKTGEKIK